MSICRIVCCARLSELAIQGRGVIVVGAGPSGLAAAAALVEKGEDVLLLERQSSIQGSWCQHFEGLTITTRAATCGLPRFPMELFTKNDEIAAWEYVEYLAAYAGTFCSGGALQRGGAAVE